MAIHPRYINKQNTLGNLLYNTFCGKNEKKVLNLLHAEKVKVNGVVRKNPNFPLYLEEKYEIEVLTKSVNLGIVRFKKVWCTSIDTTCVTM